MKISSQLANNFDYCSAEIGEFLIKNFFTLRSPRLRGAISECSFICLIIWICFEFFLASYTLRLSTIEAIARD